MSMRHYETLTKKPEIMEQKVKNLTKREEAIFDFIRVRDKTSNQEIAAGIEDDFGKVDRTISCINKSNEGSFLKSIYCYSNAFVYPTV